MYTYENMSQQSETPRHCTASWKEDIARKREHRSQVTWETSDRITNIRGKNEVLNRSIR
jgi:hypothetical protein